VSIGFFDSGIGGLSILRNAKTLLPKHDFIYIGDDANCPWGNKDADFIVKRSSQITKKLISMGAKVIVVACNTATVSAIDTLRAEFADIPFVGVEPGIKPAAQASQTGQIAVLATKATSLGERFNYLLKEFAGNTQSIVIAAPGLVELVEEGKLEGLEVETKLRELLQPVIERNVDQLVLGCTHYPFLVESIQKILPIGVTIIDTGPPVARQLARIVDEKGIPSGSGLLSIYTTGKFRRLTELVKILLGIPSIDVKSIAI